MLQWCGLGEATKRSEGFKAETRTSLFFALQAEVGRWKPLDCRFVRDHAFMPQKKKISVQIVQILISSQWVRAFFFFVDIKVIVLYHHSL